MSRFVIDTQVLVAMGDDSWCDQLLLHLVLNNGHWVCVDHGSVILRQYSANLDKPQHRFFWKWWDMMENAKRVEYHSGELSARHSRHLLCALRFDRDDFAFVAVAHRASATLVAEESDYTFDVIAYLAQEMGVECVHCSDALAVAGGLAEG